MSDIVFEVTPPRPSTLLGQRSVIEFIRDPAMLIHLRAKSELDLTTVTQATLESIPTRTNSNDDPFYVASTEPLNANGSSWLNSLEMRGPISERS